MLLANSIDVPDSMAFLDAFAVAAEKTRGWKLESIKIDYGYQFVYVRYTGRKFAGKGLMASAFALVHQYRDRQGAVLATDGRAVSIRQRTPRTTPSQFDLRHSAFAICEQRVNITLRADEWPTHACFDQSAERLLAPLLHSSHKSIQPATATRPPPNFTTAEATTQRSQHRFSPTTEQQP